MASMDFNLIYYAPMSSKCNWGVGEKIEKTVFWGAATPGFGIYRMGGSGQIGV